MKIELRIHGASGTPASQMLGGEVIDDERFGGGPSTVLRPVDGDGSLLAYRWASQTSGTPRSALWLFLVPYMLLNVAGWALPPTSDRRHRAAVAATRGSGLLLTLVFSLVTAAGLVTVGAVDILHRTWGWSWRASLVSGVLGALAVMGALWFTASRAADARNDRPHLRSPHVAMATWGVWATTVTVGGAVTDTANPIGSMWLLPAALIVLVAAASLWPGLEAVTELFGTLAIIGVAGLLVAGVVRFGGVEPTVEAMAIGGPLRGTVLALLVASVITTALAWSKEHPDAGPAVATLLATAGATGASVGAGAVVAAGAAFGVGPSSSIGAFAEAFLVGVAAIGTVTAALAWTHAEPGASPRERALLTSVSMRDDVRPLFLAVPAVTLALGVVVLGRMESVLPWLAAGMAAAFAVGAAGAAIRIGLGRWALAGPGVVLVGVAAVASTSFRTAAVGFTVLTPFVFVVARVVGAATDPERRRMAAIPWDVGSYFSRRFHPFAPPTYRDAVERDLKTVIGQLRGSGADVIVSGHSQGSVLAASTLWSMREPGVSLLTYGSPFGSLFTRFFPISFHPDVVEEVGAERWINLWRPTDPVGGAIRGPLDDRRIDDARLRAHGGYWLPDEEDFRQALADLGRGRTE